MCVFLKERSTVVAGCQIGGRWNRGGNVVLEKSAAWDLPSFLLQDFLPVLHTRMLDSFQVDVCYMPSQCLGLEDTRVFIHT